MRFWHKNHEKLPPTFNKWSLGAATNWPSSPLCPRDPVPPVRPRRRSCDIIKGSLCADREEAGKFFIDFGDRSSGAGWTWHQVKLWWTYRKMMMRTRSEFMISRTREANQRQNQTDIHIYSGCLTGRAVQWGLSPRNASINRCFFILIIINLPQNIRTWLKNKCFNANRSNLWRGSVFWQPLRLSSWIPHKPKKLLYVR